MTGIRRRALSRNDPGQNARDGLACLKKAEGLLESTSRLIGGHLEIWTPEIHPLTARPTLETCCHCRQDAPETLRACLRRRSAHASGVMAGSEGVEWSCPKGVRLAAWPIPGRERPSAALLWLNPSSAPGAPETRPFLAQLIRLLADQVFVSEELAALTSDLCTRYDELQMLYSIAGRLTRDTDLRQSLRSMLEEARQTMDADAALLSMRGRRLREVLTNPDLPPILGDDRTWRRYTQAVPHLLAQSGSRFYHGNAWDPALGPSPFPGPAQTLAVPVVRNGETDGCLALVHLDPKKSFRSSDIRLLQSLAEQVALAISNAELYADLKDFLMATVKSLVSAIEAKDAYTSGHSERVNLLSMLMGKKLGLDAAEMETLRWASILHDVGKIGMPESILNKPGRLSSLEFEIIKEHPDRGYRLLFPIRQLREAADSVRAHHEMWSGQGYPFGLAGEEIPFLARIIAVADTFDALTSNRPYRSALTMDFAIEEICRVRGTQLDPTVVDTFLELAPFLREHRVMIDAGIEVPEEKAA